MVHRARLRASDADRDQAVERLRQAGAEGRLRPDELESRLEAALSATTYGELDALLADLPRPPARRARPTLVPWLPPVVALALVVPIALVALLAVVFVLTGLFAGWLLWLFLGWWFFAGRRRAFAARGIPYAGRGAGHRHCGAHRAQSRSGFRI